jgi:hypothetical protein
MIPLALLVVVMLLIRIMIVTLLFESRGRAGEWKGPGGYGA